MSATAPSPAARAALLQEIGPLPLNGQAWPDWVRILAWILLSALGVQLFSSAAQLPPGQLNLLLAVTVGLSFLGLGLVSWFMQLSITTINDQAYIRAGSPGVKSPGRISASPVSCPGFFPNVWWY